MKVIFVIIGTVIGAGFASGKEIYLFFGQYGINGIIGIILSSILTGIIIYNVFTYINKKNITTYEKFVTNLGKGKENITTIVNIVINLFLLISYYIMVAGFSAYLFEQFNIPLIVGSIILNLLSYITFINNTKGIIKVNSILIPIAIIIIIILGIKIINPNSITQNINTSNTSINWIISSILYSSYNSILLIPILVTLKIYANEKEKIKLISIVSTTILTVLSLIIYFILLKINIDINTIEMPLVYIAGKIGPFYKYIYGLIILLAIFTTAISAGYGFLSNTAKTKKSYKYTMIFMCISSLVVTKIGFSNLIKSLYPIFGILGLIQIIMLFKIRNIKYSIEKK